MTALLLAVQDAAATDFDWAALINSILGSLVAIGGLIGVLGRWVRGFARTKDLATTIEPLITKLDQNSTTLNGLAADVRDVKTHQTGLGDRVSSLERRMDGREQNPQSGWWRR